MPAERTPPDAPSLGERYHELMGFRREAFARYRANDISIIAGPPVRVNLPTFGLHDRGTKHKRIGPLYVNDRPPIFSFVEAAIASRGHGLCIVEIGPGGGDLARHVRAQYGDRISQYYGIDRDPTVGGPWVSLATIDEAPKSIDIVIASEVIEHMSADMLVGTILEPIRGKLATDAAFIVSTPNPTAPAGIARDFTHVQNYPWYDLSAIFRLVFENVEIYRTYYAYDPKHLMQIVPRFLLCYLLEMEWCPGLVCVATRPTSP